MRLGLFSLTLSLFISNILLANISSIENNFTYSLFALNQDTTFEAAQDTTFEDSIFIVSELSIPRAKFKSPVKAMLYSAVLPGLGQAYIGKWKRGLIYLALEGIAAGVWYQNNIIAEERKKEYESYATEHWEFASWIHDFYKWEPSSPPDWFSGVDSAWDSIRAGFVNNTNEGCADPPYCYIDIWDHSHYVKFKWDNKTISSNNEAEFKPIYIALCNMPSNLDSANDDRECMSNIEEIRSANIDVIADHHFYEGIQKYDMYFSGWDDNNSLVVINSGDNDENVTSPHESSYQSIWDDYNYIKKLAGRGGKFILINHFVSMLDGLFLVKKWNAEHIVNLNLDVYPDLSNKSGVGGLKLTMGWR